MGKLVSVISGSIFGHYILTNFTDIFDFTYMTQFFYSDVAVDIRPGSSTFGKWHGVVLDGRDKTCFWIPDGLKSLNSKIRHL